MYYYIVDINDCPEGEFPAIVRAANKKQAVDKVLAELNRLYPPKILKACNLPPYRKMDIHTWRIDQLDYDENSNEVNWLKWLKC